MHQAPILLGRAFWTGECGCRASRLTLTLVDAGGEGAEDLRVVAAFWGGHENSWHTVCRWGRTKGSQSSRPHGEEPDDRALPLLSPRSPTAQPVAVKFPSLTKVLCRRRRSLSDATPRRRTGSSSRSASKFHVPCPELLALLAFQGSWPTPAVMAGKMDQNLTATLFPRPGPLFRFLC